jgi:UDP-glucose 4-epimerase
MNILITGGAGFIGSHLVDHLLLEGHSVTIIDNLSSGKIENIPKNCQLIVGDINNVELLNQIFNKIDFCYHMAAIPSVQKSVTKWVECHRTNLEGTINIFLQASKKNIPVIYASSAAVYGDLGSSPLPEDSKIKLLSPYGADKYSCELQAEVFAHIYGLNTIGLRFFNVYGLRQDPNSPYSGVISIFVDNIKNNRPINVYGDGLQQRDFVYISDVVKALILAKDALLMNNANKQQEMFKGCKIYNICTGQGVTINSLIKILFELSGKEVPVNYLPKREGDIYKSIGNPHKASDIGFSASTLLNTGLKLLL